MQLAKNPGRIVLFMILMFNIAFFSLATVIIRNLSLTGTEQMSVFEAVFYTITMILDAGCVQFVIEDIGQSGVLMAVICLVIIIIGMISFTGAVVGYITNYISDFITNSNEGSHKLDVSNHFVILNWNTRASEIINDLLYSPGKKVVVVLAEEEKSVILREINERLTDTIHRENRLLQEKCKEYSFFRRIYVTWHDRLKNNLDVIVREGDVYSAKQLHDISLEQASSIVILGRENNNRKICRMEYLQEAEELEKGNTQIIKTLMQVADITSANDSADHQKIIVEISDDWTGELVNQIIKYKQKKGKCNIVPVRVNQVLGQLLSQFSLMPELNLVYRELFSNQGVTFYVEEKGVKEEKQYITEYLKNHKHAIPLTSMKNDDESFFYYSSKTQKDIGRICDEIAPKVNVKLNYDYWIEKKTVIILGHNSKSKDIMQGFDAFRNEWNYVDGKDEILRIIVIDDQKSLEKLNYYQNYSFVEKTVAATIYDKDVIYNTIEEIVNTNDEDTSILILSDDTASNENADANALAYLVYVQDIINMKKCACPDFDVESIDVIVEITNPKHHDIVSSYSVDNVVISNRYISKMITQIGEKEAIYNFYTDILTYDAADSEEFESKEVYTKKVSLFFDEIPAKCTAAGLIRAVWNASTDESLPKEKRNPTVVLGYVKPGGEIHLFGGDQTDEYVELSEKDKIIVFTNH